MHLALSSRCFTHGSVRSLSAAQECGIYSQQKCYSLAFGVPAALMVVALGKSLSVSTFTLYITQYYIVNSQYSIYISLSCCKRCIILTVVFIAGSGMYHRAEPQGNIMLDFCKCVGVSMDTDPNHDIIGSIGVLIKQLNVLIRSPVVQFAVKNRFKHRGSEFPKRAHWMDWADEKYEVEPLYTTCFKP